MTTRRDFLTLVGASSALAIAGCTPRSTRTAAPDPAAALRDTLILDTPDGVGVLRPSGLQSLGHGVITPNAGKIFVARPSGGNTDLVSVSTTTGGSETVARLRGTWVPQVASSSLSVALTAPGTRDAGYVPTGRANTTIMVSGLSGQLLLELPGNYVPDAFAGDNTSLYVLDWLPAGTPDRYRVREIDFNTRQPTPLFTRDKQPIPPADEEKMKGQRRMAVWSPGYDILYSLYTNQPGSAGHGGGDDGTEWDAAFIHTLQLDQHWAYCIDLPQPFGSHPNAAHALASSPGGSNLYVVDVVAGKAAEVSTDKLSVIRTGEFTPMTGDAYAESTNNFLYIGAGSQVRVFDTRRMDQMTTWQLDGTVNGLVTSPDQNRIYIGRPGAVEWWDTATGTRQGSVPVAGLRGLRAAVRAG
ncbi:MAG TPA: hypothetical protein VKB69_16545 [Micromonosporaceae bacterium]|nr:hypothetical protein [Micromonosporaceae bacterium]